VVKSPPAHKRKPMSRQLIALQLHLSSVEKVITGELHRSEINLASAHWQKTVVFMARLFSNIAPE